MARLNHKAHQHIKLPGCGCKCCVTAQSTVATAPDELAAFHAYIHAVYAAHAARPRLAGDGRNPGGELFTANNHQPISPLAGWRSVRVAA